MRATVLLCASTLFLLACGPATPPPPPDQSAAVAELRSELATQTERISRLEAALAEKRVARPTGRRRTGPMSTVQTQREAPQPLYQPSVPTRSYAGVFLRGPRGGCFTRLSGRKRYVDRSLCD
jgi:hypothetical protein